MLISRISAFEAIGFLSTELGRAPGAAGSTRTIHFPGDGFTISHGGKAQNVPLKKFIPEINVLFRMGVHALNDRPVTHYPFFKTPQQITDLVTRQEARTFDEAAQKALGR